MTMARTQDPKWVDTILEWRWTWLAARIALTSAFILGGFTKLLDFTSAAAEQEHFGLNPGWLWATLTIIVELGGSALIVAVRWVWLAAGGLGVLTAVALLVADDFWTMTGAARFAATNGFFEHIGLIAGFVMAALIAEHAQRGGASRSPPPHS